MPRFHLALLPLRQLFLAGFCTTLAACNGLPEDIAVDPTPSACSAPAGRSITDIQSVVDWINDMPKPLSLPCFTQSLPRPLKVYVSLGSESAQPAINAAKPRFFIFINDLTLSVVPGETFATHQDGSPQDANSGKFNQLELSLPTKGYSSIKGELHFPVREPLPRAAPYAELEYFRGYSICGICHHSEYKFGTLDGVSIFESDRKMPREPQDLAIARNEFKTCDHTAEPYHCEMMDAIFSHGEVVWQDFPVFLQGHF